MRDGDVTEAIAALWRRSLGPGRDFRTIPCAVSGNNRVFKVEADGRAAIAKWYVDSPNRDRLDSEWRFLTYATGAGIACVPAPLARDDASRIALHGFCAGIKPTPAEIGEAQVDAAADFLLALNRPKHDADLPEAAEAAFSAEQHFTILERRIGLLAGIEEPEARDLAARMAACWRDLRETLTRTLDPAPLPHGLRCISPSDFGFHNAVLAGDGAPSFFDFEYGGWDDPAKALCDFTLQPGVPVAPELGRRFMARAAHLWPDTDALLARARALRPMFALKWCCIMLNPFVPALARPGQFSDPTADLAERKTRQLAKARAAFNSLLSERD